MKLTKGLRAALRSLRDADPKRLRTGRETTRWQVPHRTGEALERLGLARMVPVPRVHIDYEVELTDAGREVEL